MDYYAVYLKEQNEISYILDAIFVLLPDAEAYKELNSENDAIIKIVKIKDIPFKIQDDKVNKLNLLGKCFP